VETPHNQGITQGLSDQNPQGVHAKKKEMGFLSVLGRILLRDRRPTQTAVKSDEHPGTSRDIALKIHRVRR
jgi:hypothetical protein